MSLRQEISSQRLHRISMPLAPVATLSDGIVSVRMPRPVDAGLLAEYVTSGELDGLWVGGPSEGADPAIWAGQTIDDWIDGWTETGSNESPTLIVDEESPFAGVVSFVPLRADAVEILYGVHPQKRRRGIASRALRLATDWVLDATPFDVVELKISETNVGSLLAASSAGFAFVERFETFVTGTGQTHIDHLFTRRR